MSLPETQNGEPAGRARVSGAGSVSPARRRLDVRRLDVRRLPDHRDRLFRAAYGLTHSRDDAEDLVQETYERLLRRPRFLRRDDDLAYTLKVMRNCWINSRREHERRMATVEWDDRVEYIVDPSADPAVTVSEVQAIYDALERLSPVLRETLVAVDILGLSYKQAASALEIRPGTVMSRLHRARGEVARQLERPRS